MPMMHWPTEWPLTTVQKTAIAAMATLRPDKQAAARAIDQLRGEKGGKWETHEKYSGVFGGYDPADGCRHK